MYNDHLIRFLADDRAAGLLREADRRRLAETARQGLADRLIAVRRARRGPARTGSPSTAGRAAAW